MIREDKFLISKRPYAVDLSTTLRILECDRNDGTHYYRVDVPAAWFRRRSGVTVAVLGGLWDYQDERPATVEDFLIAHEDGRYGGAWVARWDGDTYVSEWPQPPEAIEEHMAVLRPMLDNYPAAPPNHEWWRFQTDKERFGR